MKVKLSALALLLLVLGASYCQPIVSLKAYLDAHNKARTNPGYYSTFIANEFKSKTDSNTNTHSVWRLRFFEQSPAQFDEAINAMNAQPALSPLSLNLGMTYSVWKHIKYLADTLKTLSHTGEGGTTPSQRAQPYTSGTAAMYENILFTGVSAHTAEHIVAQYIIDDGVSTRGHRRNVFTASQTQIGIGIAYDYSLRRFYHGVVMANSFNCDKCSLITCAQQAECGWTQYLADSGLADPCASRSTTTPTTTTPTTTTPTTTTPTTTTPTTTTPTTTTPTTTTPTTTTPITTTPTTTTPTTTTPTTTTTTTTFTITSRGIILKSWPANLPTIKQYLDAQNKARTDPKFFATFITNNYKNVVNPTTNVHPTWRLMFNEPATTLFDNAIGYLNSAAAVPALIPDLGLTFAAWSQANYCATVLKGQSFTGPNGSDTRTRAQAYTSTAISFLTENLMSTFVGAMKPEDYVSKFILDDGLTSRPRRASIFNSAFKYVGIGLAKDTVSSTNKYYLSEVLATNYSCDKCSIITCQQQADCGWRQYLVDAGLPDPCRG